MRATTFFIALTSLAITQPGFAQSPRTQPASRPDFASLDAKVRAGEFQKITSVVVLQDGKLLHEAYFDGDAETLRNTRSVTKTITALLMGAAIERGHIKDVRQPVMRWFSDLKPLANADPRKERITIEDLLTMSSLLECDDENSFSRGNEERMYLVEDWAKFAMDLPIKGFPPWATPPAKSPYGRAWAYCTAGVSTLGVLLERATHKPLPQFAEEVLYRPMAISKPKWAIAPLGYGQAGGGTEYRTRDLANLAELIRRGGEWNGRQIVPRAWVQTMTAPHAHIDDERGDYGYLTWLPTYRIGGQDYPAMAMLGTGGNRVIIVPKLRLVAAITSANFRNRDAHALSQKLFEELIVPAVTAR